MILTIDELNIQKGEIYVYFIPTGTQVLMLTHFNFHAWRDILYLSTFFIQ